MTNSEKKIHILRVAVFSPLRQSFDYLPPEGCDIKNIKPGMRVLVPFGKREVVGIVLEVVNDTNYDINKLKLVLDILDDDVLFTETMLSFVNWISSYYHHPIGDVFNNALPSLLRKKSNKKLEDYRYDDKVPDENGRIDSKVEPNEHQKQAIDEISKKLGSFGVFLLDGVTGSGKTEVYLRVIEKVIAEKKQALILVPEINLTPQTIKRFSERFPVKIAVLHSRLTQKERLCSWLMAKEGVAPIVIGTRSAIFTPLKDPGIIIIDEEHDLSFKQQTSLRYSARDLAVVRGRLEKIPVVLGTATPSLESIHNAKVKRYAELKLPERAGSAIHPSFHVIDMRSQKLKDGMAEGLFVHIKRHLSEDGQVLIFLNRRGFAPVLLCHHCSWAAGCKSCDARLTIHQKKKHLRCHHCGLITSIPIKCPECEGEKLLRIGFGTERIEESLGELFPEAKLVRIDSDTTRKKNSLNEKLEDVHKGNYQILVGTQMLAKGHHFPNVTMVAILNVDQGLFGFDFRSGEHLAQLVMQVAGRAGRAQKPGEVYLQTHNPHHQLILDLIDKGYEGFVDNCFQERQAARLPPYSYLALFQAEAKKQEVVLDFLNLLCSKASEKVDDRVRILGPVPTAMERKAGYFRAQLLLQCENRRVLHEAIRVLSQLVDEVKPQSGLRWFLDVDPVDLGG